MRIGGLGRENQGETAAGRKARWCFGKAEMVMTGPSRSNWMESAKMLGVGLEMGIVIGGMTYLGHLGDEKWGWSPWLTLGGCLGGLAVSIFNVIQQMGKAAVSGKHKTKESGIDATMNKQMKKDE